VKDKTITAVVALSGFVITLAIAWHGGAFVDATDADQIARAPVRLTDPMTTLPFAGHLRLASADSASAEATSGPDANAGIQAEGENAPQAPQADVQPGLPPQSLAQSQDSQFAAQQQLPASDQPPTSPEDAPPLYGSFGNEAPAANDGDADSVSPEERATRSGNRHH
jgi:hypothetical protein